MPAPKDPRTPQQRITDQLAAAHRQLTREGLSRSQRARIADRIHDLKEQQAALS
ncbi:hypothetical protein GCM10010377_68490 [Streptomyces viridiviolaceus]|uniref:Uncharacterized protein n=1 Tax=Streptomyces viridiviolaceus TaxID=68282 RepID=A0ABW2E7W1_9ACTN|nr:hypothetical protein [Streptomyces viridiviolaceus]GHB67878.1 hypothetical protein GCM10010377_68490 [Streptomyces viridiviolaceus]